jgi:hypothetical protein
LLVPVLASAPPAESEQERAAAAALAAFRTSGIGYLIEQNTRPQALRSSKPPAVIASCPSAPVAVSAGQPRPCRPLLNRGRQGIQVLTARRPADTI